MTMRLYTVEAYQHVIYYHDIHRKVNRHDDNNRVTKISKWIEECEEEATFNNRYYDHTAGGVENHTCGLLADPLQIRE